MNRWGPSAWFFGKRAASAALTLLGASLVTFLILTALPGDPFTALVSPDHMRLLSPDQEAALRQRLGLDGPWLCRFVSWTGKAMTGDFGLSLRTNAPVAQEINARLIATLELNALALGLTALIALPLGWTMARRSGTWWGRGFGPLLIALYALPTIWVALVLQHFLAVRWGWLPLFGRTEPGVSGLWPRVSHLLMPATCLALHILGFFTLFARDTAREGWEGSRTTFARACGVPERRIFFQQAIRPSLVPLATLLGLTIPALATGSVLIENLFSWPGLGNFFLQSLLSRDTPVVLGLAFLAAVLTVGGSLLADVLTWLADPRVGRGGGPGP